MSGGDQGPTAALDCRGITRRFGPLVALDRVDFALAPGEIHALVGENGAGKSTLAKIIAGALRPDAGAMELFGEPYAPASRRAGSAHGVAHVRQQLSLVRGLTVAENLQLGRPGASGRYDAAAAQAEVERWCDDLDLEVPALALVDDLPLAIRQQAEILISVAWGARLLILDEPSSALGPRETESLITLCHRLRAEGTPIVYISHRLPELVELADRLSVLRQGQLVEEGVDVRKADLQQVATLMIGDVSLLDVNRPSIAPGPVRLRVDSVSADLATGVGLHDISVEVRGGEILGIVGVAGSGQEALALALTGQLRPRDGSIVVDGTQHLRFGERGGRRRCRPPGRGSGSRAGPPLSPSPTTRPLGARPTRPSPATGCVGCRASPPTLASWRSGSRSVRPSPGRSPVRCRAGTSRS